MAVAGEALEESAGSGVGDASARVMTTEAEAEAEAETEAEVVAAAATEASEVGGRTGETVASGGDDMAALLLIGVTDAGMLVC